VAVTRKRTATARTSSIQGGGFDKELLRRVGLAIRVARVGRGLSQRELAQTLGRSQNLIWTIESGKKDPGVLFLAQLADALRMPLEFFLIPVQKIRTHTPSDRKRDFEEGQAMMVSLMEAWAKSANDRSEVAHTKKPKSSTP
jgi:transcriptional regulator with XRE-family HTH domain